MSEIEDLRKRISALERFNRDIIISTTIIGSCLIAFFGYQSFIGIPKAVESSLKQEAMYSARSKVESYVKQAENSLKQIRQFEQEASTAKIDTDQILENFNKNLSRVQALERAAEEYPLEIENACKFPIRIAIKYKAAYGVMYSVGWWKFKPSEKNTMSYDGDSVKLGSPSMYYYAESTDGSNIVWSGEETINVLGKNLKMKKISVIKEDNQYKLRLHCTNHGLSR